MPAGEAHVAGQHELITDAARPAANLGDAHDWRGPMELIERHVTISNEALVNHVVCATSACRLPPKLRTYDCDAANRRLGQKRKSLTYSIPAELPLAVRLLLLWFQGHRDRVIAKHPSRIGRIAQEVVFGRNFLHLSDARLTVRFI